MLVLVKDKMQPFYLYERREPMGSLPPEFKPNVTPREMLELGVFGGKYMTDCANEFPDSWFRNAKLSPEFSDPSLNYFKVNASQSLATWRENGWIKDPDPRGWFQWYCRFYSGRRLPEYDDWQIQRWYNIRRHLTALINQGRLSDLSASPRRRQALLHWAILVDGTQSAEQLQSMFTR